MRIGVMLRHYDQHGGGVRVYTRALLNHMLRPDSPHEFVLFFNDRTPLGNYPDRPNVEEVTVPGRSVLAWDQISLPRAVRRYGVDVLFNPKYSLPLSGHYPSAWVCHGLDWYVMPWASRWIDRLSHRHLVPRYAARASAIVAVSEVTREHLMEYLHVPSSKVHTVYTGVDEAFRKTLPPETLAAVRQRFGLPERYVLYAGAVYPPKNFTRLVQAYARVGPKSGVSLVIAGGENRFLSEHELQEPARLGLGDWVKWAGWVDNTTLPAFYQMAEALLLPSLFESFGMPIVEAMACGCPVVTSNRYGTQEIAGPAAVLVDPDSVEAIADGLARALADTALRTDLIARGRERARQFTWENCARQTLSVLESIR
ncbi:MAG TPA: glycosyltransferase family 1 protein, partial [Steroidobacteraceae bacterium]|nr:glycosyltransferase family 1 protein [Steroidobacteraceae bacterium]